MSTTPLTASNLDSFLNDFDCFLFDCDGVIWTGEERIAGVSASLSKLKEMGKKVLFLSNNSTKSRPMYIKKFKSMDIDATEDQVITSAYATAYYVADKLKDKKVKKVFIIGQIGVEYELEQMGIEVIKINDEDHMYDHNDYLKFSPDPEVSAVVCGLDRNMSYMKMAVAHAYLRNPDVLFVGTNGDKTFPLEGGRFAPGTGCIVEFLETSSGRKATMIGKPCQPIIDCVVRNFKVNVERTCMVGDRLDTDILFGQAGNMGTLVVFTGVTKREDLTSETNKIHPQYSIASVGDLF